MSSWSLRLWVLGTARVISSTNFRTVGVEEYGYAIANSLERKFWLLLETNKYEPSPLSEKNKQLRFAGSGPSANSLKKILISTKFWYQFCKNNHSLAKQSWHKYNSLYKSIIVEHKRSWMHCSWPSYTVWLDNMGPIVHVAVSAISRCGKEVSRVCAFNSEWEKNFKITSCQCTVQLVKFPFLLL